MIDSAAGLRNILRRAARIGRSRMTQRCWKAGQVLAAVAAFGALLAAPALAQVDCRALGRQIAAYDRGGPGTGEARRYAQAAA